MLGALNCLMKQIYAAPLNKQCSCAGSVERSISFCIRARNIYKSVDVISVFVLKYMAKGMGFALVACASSEAS